MAIGITVEMCVKNCIDKGTARDVAPFFDLITGAALLVLGILGISGTLPFSSAASWALIGAGICYTGLIVYGLLAQIVKKQPALRDKC